MIDRIVPEAESAVDGRRLCNRLVKVRFNVNRITFSVKYPPSIPLIQDWQVREFVLHILYKHCSFT